jgi:hypothetical protein
MQKSEGSRQMGRENSRFKIQDSKGKRQNAQGKMQKAKMLAFRVLTFDNCLLNLAF